MRQHSHYLKSRAALWAPLLVCLIIPLAAAANFAAVDQALEAGQVDEAEKLLLTITDAEATVVRYQSRLAMRRDDYKLALKLAQQAVELEPSADNFAQLGNSFGFRAQRGGTLGKLGAAKKAKRAWEQALSIDPNHLTAHQSLIQFHIQAPGIAGGSKKQARRLVEVLTDLDAEQGQQARFSLALAEEDSDSALAIAQSLYQDHRDNPRYGHQLGTVYQQKEQYRKAWEALSENLSRHPDHWDSVYQLGRTAALGGIEAEAGLAALARFIALSQRSDGWLAAAHWRSAQIAQNQGDLAAARNSIEQSLQLDPKSKPAKKLRKSLAKN